MKRLEYTVTLYTPIGESNFVILRGPARAALAGAALLREQLRPAHSLGAQVAIWCPEVTVTRPLRSWRVVALKRGDVDVLQWRLEYRHGHHHRPHAQGGASP